MIRRRESNTSPPTLYRGGVKVNSNGNGKIEKDIKRHPIKNRHVYKSYLRLVPTSDGGRRSLVAGNGYFEGSALAREGLLLGVTVSDNGGCPKLDNGSPRS